MSKFLKLCVDVRTRSGLARYSPLEPRIKEWTGMSARIVLPSARHTCANVYLYRLCNVTLRDHHASAIHRPTLTHVKRGNYKYVRCSDESDYKTPARPTANRFPARRFHVTYSTWQHRIRYYERPPGGGRAVRVAGNTGPSGRTRVYSGAYIDRRRCAVFGHVAPLAVAARVLPPGRL
ncbi:hypothetical protein EVAR_79580_1 [Eumeta japonica]|uniref:Uncharacterized protein n=1 Tax=Eumeta variegata TaxID=151549 RepID=A0A4C1UE31_EUMVA|nr:hypothetical protein EVAR_79580_1 [Eumeta japonica]